MTAIAEPQMEKKEKNMLERIKSVLKQDEKFPLKKQENGMYPRLESTDGWLRCYNCGDFGSLSTKLNRHCLCNTCYYEFYDYGVLGLVAIEKK